MARYSSADRLCIVCGHNLGPYGRICDKCGSIQRPTRGDGLLIPPEKATVCERCGLVLPEGCEDTVCESCRGTDTPQPVLWIEDLPTYRKTKIASAAISLASAAALATSIVLLFIIGAVGWEIILISVSALGVGAAGAVYFIYARKPTGEIQHYEGIKPESPLQQAGKK